MSQPVAAVERILQFICDVKVEKQFGDLLVTETIRVKAEGREIRRGILRDFPTTLHRDATAAAVEVGFTVLSVTRNGSPENFATEALSNGVRMRIGSADRPVPIRAEHLCDPVPHHAADRLLREVRRAVLERDRHRLDLPDRCRRSAHHAAGEGRFHPDRDLYRAAGRDRARTRRSSSSVRARSCFAPRARCRTINGLTVAAAWPQGHRHAADVRRSSRGYWLRDNLPIVVGGGGILAAARLFRFRLVQGRARSARPAPSSRCSRRRRTCRRRRFAMSMRWSSTIVPSAQASSQLAVHGGVKLIDSGERHAARPAATAARDVSPPIAAMSNANCSSRARRCCSTTSTTRSSEPARARWRAISRTNIPEACSPTITAGRVSALLLWLVFTARGRAVGIRQLRLRTRRR